MRERALVKIAHARRSRARVKRDRAKEKYEKQPPGKIEIPIDDTPQEKKLKHARYASAKHLDPFGIECKARAAYGDPQRHGPFGAAKKNPGASPGA